MPSPIRFSLRYLFALVAIASIASWLVGAFSPMGPILAMMFVTALCGGIAFVGRRDSVAGACAVGFVLLGIVCIPVVQMSGHPVPIAGLNRVRAGMPKSEVRTLLGNPTRIRGHRWLYSGTTWCHVTIHFAADDRVDYVDHDH